jgi:hypothetical protein
VRRALPVAAVALAALIGPAAAKAHGRTAKLAVDYEASVAALPPALAAAVEARLYRTDLAIRLTALGSHRIVVLGYEDEPFLRLGPAGAYVNGSSLTAAGTGLATRSDRRGWQRYARQPQVVRHDARVHAVSPGVRPPALDDLAARGRRAGATQRRAGGAP